MTSTGSPSPVPFDDLGATGEDLWDLVSRVQHYHGHMFGERWQAIDKKAHATRAHIHEQADDFSGVLHPTLYTFGINFFDPTVPCGTHLYQSLPEWFRGHLDAGNPAIQIRAHRYLDDMRLAIETTITGNIWGALLTCLVLYNGSLTLEVENDEEASLGGLVWTVSDWQTTEWPDTAPHS